MKRRVSHPGVGQVSRGPSRHRRARVGHADPARNRDGGSLPGWAVRTLPCSFRTSSWVSPFPARAQRPCPLRGIAASAPCALDDGVVLVQPHRQRLAVKDLFLHFIFHQAAEFLQLSARAATAPETKSPVGRDRPEIVESASMMARRRSLVAGSGLRQTGRRR